MRKAIIIAGVVTSLICAALIFGVFFMQRDAITPRDLTISDYPTVFATEAVIVIGEQAFNKSLTKKATHASLIESAEAIAANFGNIIGNKPEEVISSKKNRKV